jgi:SSS family solute:Na+ symporter
VQNAYKVTLVGAFVPLAAGVFWRQATTQGALLAVVVGVVVWILMEMFATDAVVPPQLGGLCASIAGMLLGSLLPQRYGAASRQPHAAAAR